MSSGCRRERTAEREREKESEQHKPFTRLVSVSIMSRKDSQCRKVHNKFAICIEKLFGFVATQSQMPGLIYWGHFKC